MIKYSFWSWCRWWCHEEVSQGFTRNVFASLIHSAIVCILKYVIVIVCIIIYTLLRCMIGHFEVRIRSYSMQFGGHLVQNSKPVFWNHLISPYFFCWDDGKRYTVGYAENVDDKVFVIAIGATGKRGNSRLNTWNSWMSYQDSIHA